MEEFQPVISQTTYQNFTEMTEAQRWERGEEVDKELKAFQDHWDRIELLAGEKKVNPQLEKVKKVAEVPQQPVEQEKKLGLKERRERRKLLARQEAERAEKERKQRESAEEGERVMRSYLVDEYEDEMHRKYKDQTGFPDLHFHDKMSYENIIATQETIRKGHEGYMANKELVDRIFLDMVNLIQMSDRLQHVNSAYGTGMYDSEVMKKPQVQKYMERKTNELGKRAEHLSLRIVNLQGCIRYLTRHTTDETNRTMQVLSEYRKDGDFELQKLKNIEDAKVYLEVLDEQSKRESQEENAETKADRHTAMFKELMLGDTRSLSIHAYDPEKLTEMIKDAFNADEILHLPKEEKERLFVKPASSKLSDALYYRITEAKLEKIKAYGKIARGRLILRAVKSSDIVAPQEFMTDAELEEYMKSFSSGAGVDLLASFARDLIAEGNASIELSQKKLISSKDAIDYVVGHDINDRLKEECFTLNGDLQDKYLKLADEKGEAMKQSLSKEEQENFQTQYEGAKALYRDACEALTDEEWVKANPEQAKVFEDTKKYMPIVIGATARHFKFAGEEKDLIKEAFARSFRSSQQYDSFRSMTDEAYTDMMSKISTGTFLDQTATKEEKESAQAVQKEGLETYYARTLEHYNMLDRKFGYEMPGFEYILENIDEIMQISANIQVDVNMITHDKVVLNRRNPDHLRLIHLVNFYNSYFLWITSTWPYIQMSKDKEDVYGEVKTQLEEAIKDDTKKYDLGSDLSYLRANRPRD